jgi:hypothetical protein
MVWGGGCDHINVNHAQSNTYHIPSSCIVVMVHVVKVVNILVHTQSMAPQSWQRWSLRPTLDLDSDNF